MAEAEPAVEDGSGVAAEIKSDSEAGGDVEALGEGSIVGGPSGDKEEATAEAGEEVKSEAGAPDSYDEFELPENFAIHEDDLQWIHEFAKEDGMTQEAAQGLISRASEWQQRLLDRMDAGLREQDSKWKAEIMADPTIGGDNFEPTMNSVQRLFGFAGEDGKEFKEVLIASGQEFRPAIVRALAKLAQGVSEDSTLRGGTSASNSEKAILDNMYPNTD